MSQQVIGKCSICGGDVVAWQGVWHGVNPPPGPKCTNCGAVPKYSADGTTIPMVPAGGTRP